MMRLSAMAFALALLFPLVAHASCGPVSHEGRNYTVCQFATSTPLRMWHADQNGAPYGGFGSLSQALAAEGKALIFAMNGGMYHVDRSPVGLYIEDGQSKSRIVTQEGPGNFGLLPNGVFCMRPGQVDIVESRSFAAAPLPCTNASQSGPMLVIEGTLHPRFLANSDSRHIRNGVGVSRDGTEVFFAISEERVNFHEFGRLFRDKLGALNALYLDGKVSRLYSAELNRADGGFPIGPIVGLAVEQ